MSNDSELWDKNWAASEWAQSQKRLARTPEVLVKLVDLLQSDPLISGKLLKLAPKPDMSENTLFFSAEWKETGDQVLIKTGCTEMDYFWARALDEFEGAREFSPRLFASNSKLGDEDIRWLVMEHISYPLDRPVSDETWDIIAKAVVAFQEVAAQVNNPKVFPVDAQELKQFLSWGLDAAAPDNAKRLLERLDRDLAWIEKICPPTVCFGDLQIGNILSRTAQPEVGSIVLIDPIPRLGPWVFDPAYCQIISANSDASLVEKVSKCRGLEGLPVGNHDDLKKATKLMLGWLGIMWWGLSPQRRQDENWAAQIKQYIEAAEKIKI